MISTFFNNFFNCFTMPTTILNNEFETISTYNNENSIQNSFYLLKAITYLKNSNLNTGINSILLNNDINYTCIIFSHFDNLPIYILLGPYKIKDISVSIESNNILSINQSWLDNIIKLYTYIIDNHICMEKVNITNSPCVNHAIEYIKNNYSYEISIDTLCNKLNINKCYFCSIFKKETGYTFINYLNNFKIEKSKELLKDPTLSLLDISLSVGFNNQSYYSTVFKKFTKKSPLEFRDEYFKKTISKYKTL